MTNKLNKQFIQVMAKERTDRQIICDAFGVPYHVSYRSEFANKPTPARRRKMSQKARHDHIKYSPAHSNVGGTINRRLFG